MKFIHISDLHLGKRVSEFSMLEDQAYILRQILRVLDDEQPDAVLIAGDVYDKSVPSAEAVELFDDFLVRLAARRLQVFIVSGNHDSPERLAFAGRLIDAAGVHLSPVYNGHVEPIRLTDAYGAVSVFLLPFVKPANVRRFFPEAEIASYTDAVRTAVEAMPVDPAGRNVIVTHQFVTGALRCDSEDVSVGGADNVDAAVFDAFDYAALGHIHNPQNVGSPRLRYCGTPLKYSFSEAARDKSVTVAELREKGSLTVRTVPLVPLRDMAELRGSYAELTLRANYENTPYPGDYLHITLTDEEDIPDAVRKLRVIYPYLMRLDYDNRRTRREAELDGAQAPESRTPFELFAEFYEKQNNAPLSDEQSAFLRELIERIWEEKP
jgi:exonuclease SbcD